MFSKKGKSFTVQFSGRAGLEYSEGDKKVCIDSEMLAGPEFDLVIYLRSVSCWDSPPGDSIGDAEKGRIRLNITEALAGQKIDWQ